VLYFLTFYSFSSSSSSDCSDSYRSLGALHSILFYYRIFKNHKVIRKKVKAIICGFWAMILWWRGGEGSCCCYDVCFYGGAVFFIFFLDQFLLILSSFSCAFSPRGFLNLWISEDGCRSSICEGLTKADVLCNLQDTKQVRSLGFTSKIGLHFPRFLLNWQLQELLLVYRFVKEVSDCFCSSTRQVFDVETSEDVLQIANFFSVFELSYSSWS
jgi:hypothetical protein